MLNTISCHFPLGHFPQLYQWDQEDVSPATLIRMDKKIAARRAVEFNRVVELIQAGIDERKEARRQQKLERAWRRQAQRAAAEGDRVRMEVCERQYVTAQELVGGELVYVTRFGPGRILGHVDTGSSCRGIKRRRDVSFDYQRYYVFMEVNSCLIALNASHRISTYSR